MQDDINDPATLPTFTPAKPGRASVKRTALLLGIGMGIGLALGILLTLSVSATHTLFTQTLPATRESVQVFNELNELRQQINRLNEEKALQEKEKEAAVRQALQAVTATVRTPASGTTSTMPPAAKPQGPFAEIDAEIERLEQTQKVLNTILDMFSREGKERVKDR